MKSWSTVLGSKLIGSSTLMVMWDAMVGALVISKHLIIKQNYKLNGIVRLLMTITIC